MRKYKLNELGTVARGKSKHRPRNDSQLFGGQYPFIQTGDVKHAPLYINSHSQTYNEKGLEQSKLWPAGTLCITIAANIADTAILSYPACFPDSVIGFNAHEKVADTKYVKYCLDTFQLQMRSISQGTTQDNMSLEKLLSIKFPVPELDQQRKVAAILTSYDDLIENNKRRITLLENMAEEIYREWFVRFRFPGWQEAEFEKGYPASWCALKFDEFCKLKRGYDLPDSKVMDGPYPVLASTSVKTFHSEYKVKAPVITTGRSGSLGTVLFKRENCWPLNTALYVQNFKGNSPFFVYFTLKNMPLETFNSGAGVPSLNRNHLAGLRVVVPDETAQKKFDDVVEPIFRQVDTLKDQSEHLLKTKNQLLPRLISGKLSVENLDIQFPPSMQSDHPDSSDEAAA